MGSNQWNCLRAHWTPAACGPDSFGMAFHVDGGRGQGPKALCAEDRVTVIGETGDRRVPRVAPWPMIPPERAQGLMFVQEMTC